MVASPRSRRVLVLLAGVIVLSVADLFVTLTYLHTTGMMEANPLAAWIIRTTQCSYALSAYKVFTLAVAVILLYHVRRHIFGEIGAWLAVFILAGVSIAWHRYADILSDPNEVMLAQSGACPDQWLSLSD